MKYIETYINNVQTIKNQSSFSVQLGIRDILGLDPNALHSMSYYNSPNGKCSFKQWYQIEILIIYK